MRRLKRILMKIKIRYFLRNLKYRGDNIKLYFPLVLHGKKFISIGSNSSIGEYSHVWGHGGLFIGNNVLIAAHCCISTLNHNYSCPIITLGGITSKPVVIEDDVWLGYNVVVLPGVTIGQGSVIGAGSVVTKDIPPYSVVVGNPAKVVKKRTVN